MVRRIVIFTLIAALAMPASLLTSTEETGYAPSGALVAIAKSNRNKKKPRTQRTTTVQRALRGPITQTFLSTEKIVIPAGAPGTTKGSANPYPSTIQVGGFVNGVITDVDLLLLDVTHRVEEDIDILLSKDDGRQALVMSDAGRIFSVTDLDLTLDDEAASALPNGQLNSGVFRPTDIDVPGQEPDTFAAPAPTPNGSVALSTFDGANPNGTWHLFVTDDASGDSGDIAGWALRITAEVDLATVDEQVRASKDTRKGKRGKKGNGR
jgi:hypothetical protein